MTNVLAEWLSKHDIKQAHIAGQSRPNLVFFGLIFFSSRALTSTPYMLLIETEKYAHVTFFFNGGLEKQFKGEERHMIDSPKVATYDKLPKMSVQGVANKVAQVVKENQREFVMCNFAPPDMVRPLIWLSLLRRPCSTHSPFINLYSNTWCSVFGWFLLQ
jgi:2,3-bisphosphoglycerate-independent phosphoglycerate mutase